MFISYRKGFMGSASLRENKGDRSLSEAKGLPCVLFNLIQIQLNFSLSPLYPTSFLSPSPIYVFSANPWNTSYGAGCHVTLRVKRMPEGEDPPNLPEENCKLWWVWTRLVRKEN